MDAIGSAATGALRVGIQVISNHKKPVLEIYHEVHNEYGPEIEKHRFQDIFISFLLINIGSIRAENVIVSIGGNFTRGAPRTFGELFGANIAQVAPGQAIYLCRLEQHDLYKYENGSAAALKDEHLVITAEYDGPWRGINRVFRVRSHLRGLKQYQTRYEFNAKNVATDLPPPKYP